MHEELLSRLPYSQVRALATLSQAFQSLADRHYTLLIKVKTQQVQNLKGLTDKAMICFVVWMPPEVLKAKENTT